MPTYISLMSLTEQGIRDIKSASERIAAGAKLLEQMGGKLLDFYMVFGEYDYVAIAEAPDDETAARFLLALGAQGNVRTKTMPAFNREQMARIVEGLE